MSKSMIWKITVGRRVELDDVIEAAGAASRSGERSENLGVQLELVNQLADRTYVFVSASEAGARALSAALSEPQALAAASASVEQASVEQLLAVR